MPNSNVLLIDDDSCQHELFSCYAAAANFTDMSYALNLEEGLVLINEEIPQVILLDDRLSPFLNFKETIPKIRASGFKGRIVVISADVDGISQKEMRDYSVHDCIDKVDFDFTNFKNTIGALLYVENLSSSDKAAAS